MEQMSISHKYVAMIRARVVTVKHGISDLMLALKEAEIKVEAIMVHMHHKQTATKNLKEKVETPKVVVHVG